MPGHPDPRMNLALTLEQAGPISTDLPGWLDLIALQGETASLASLGATDSRAGGMEVTPEPHTHVDLLSPALSRSCAAGGPAGQVGSPPGRGRLAG